MPLHKCVKALLLLPVVLAVAVLALFGLALCLDLVQNSFNTIQWVAAFLVSVSKKVAWKFEYLIYEQTGVWFLDSFGKAVAWKFEHWMMWTVLPALYCAAGASGCTLVRRCKCPARKKVIERFKQSLRQKGDYYMKHEGELWALWPLAGGTDYTHMPQYVFLMSVDATGFVAYLKNICGSARASTFISDAVPTPPFSRTPTPDNVFTVDVGAAPIEPLNSVPEIHDVGAPVPSSAARSASRVDSPCKTAW